MLQVVLERMGHECDVAENGDAHVRTAMAAGVDDFLTKPLERSQLALRLALAARLQALRARVSELETRA